MFKKAVESMIKTYLGEDDYKAYYDETQTKIETVGYYINNVYVEENITIKEMQIPVDEVIYMDDVTLASYLLFGTTDKQRTYVVQEGDTISSIALNNKISTSEFLISNRQFKSESSLLFAGQEVVIGVTDPQIKVVVEKALGKPIGNYVTVDVKKLKLAGEDEIQKTSQVLSEELKKITENVHTHLFAILPEVLSL